MTNMLVCPSHLKFHSTFLTAPNIAALAATFPIHTTHNASDGAPECSTILRVGSNRGRGRKSSFEQGSWNSEKSFVSRLLGGVGKSRRFMGRLDGPPISGGAPFGKFSDARCLGKVSDIDNLGSVMRGVGRVAVVGDSCKEDRRTWGRVGVTHATGDKFS